MGYALNVNSAKQDSSYSPLELSLVGSDAISRGDVAFERGALLLDAGGNGAYTDPGLKLLDDSDDKAVPDELLAVLNELNITMGKNNQFYQRGYKAHGMNGSSLSREDVLRRLDTEGYALDQSIIDNYLTKHERVNRDEHCRDITMEYNTRHLDDKLTTFRVNDILTQEGISVARTGRNFYRYDSDAGMVRSLSRDSVLDLIGEAYSSDNPVPVASSGDDGGYRFTVGHFIRTLAASFMIASALSGTSCRSVDSQAYRSSHDMATPAVATLTLGGAVLRPGDNVKKNDGGNELGDIAEGNSGHEPNQGTTYDIPKSRTNSTTNLRPDTAVGDEPNLGTTYDIPKSKTNSTTNLRPDTAAGDEPNIGTTYDTPKDKTPPTTDLSSAADHEPNIGTTYDTGADRQAPVVDRSSLVPEINPGTIDDTVSDTTAPIFTYKPYDIQSNSVTIPITLNEDATLVLKYATGSDLSNTQEYDLVSGNNSITLDGLVANTPYFTNMIFTDSHGNSNEYSDSFLTAKETNSGSDNSGNQSTFLCTNDAGLTDWVGAGHKDYGVVDYYLETDWKKIPGVVALINSSILGPVGTYTGDNGSDVNDAATREIGFDTEPTLTLDGSYVNFNLDFDDGSLASVRVGQYVGESKDSIAFSDWFRVGNEPYLVRNTGFETGNHHISLEFKDTLLNDVRDRDLNISVPDTNSKYDQPSLVGSFFRDLSKFPGGRPRTDTNDVNRSGWDNIRLRLGYTWNYGVKANFRNFLRTQFGLEGGADQVVKSYDGESNVGYGKRTGKSVPRGLGGIVGNLPLVGHAVDIAQGDSLEDTFLNPDENYTARAVRGTYSGGKAVVQTTTNVINKVAVQPVSAVVQGVGKLASYIPGLRGLRNKCKPVDALKKSVFGDVYQAGGHLVNAVRGNNGSRLGELRSARMEATSMLTGDPDGNDYHLPYVGTNGSPLGEAFSGVSGVVKPLKDVVNNIVLPEFGAVMSLSMAGGNGGQLVSDATFGNFCPTYRLSDFLFDDVLQGVATAVDPSQLTEGLDMGNGFTDNLDLTSAPLAYPLFHPQSERARGRMNGGWELINTGDHGIESANDPNEGATFLGGLLDVGRDIGAGFIIEDNLPKHEREPPSSTLKRVQ